jgi:hypothetical protein
VDILSFLFRSHLFGNIDKLTEIMGVLGSIRHFDPFPKNEG